MSEKTQNSINSEDEKIERLKIQNLKLEAELSSLRSCYQSINIEPLSDDKNYEIDFRELWRSIWSGRVTILIITFIFSVCCFVATLIIPNVYRSTAILTPASSSSSSSLSKLASQFGGIASLAGIDIGAGGNDEKSQIALELLSTWRFQQDFIRENNIEKEVFAAIGWDSKSDEIIFDAELVDVESGNWIRDFDPDKGETLEPSGWELHEEFKDLVFVRKDEETGFIHLSVEYYSPNLAREWVGKLVRSLNDHIRLQDRKEALSSIEYLEEQIQQTNIADMKSVFYELIEEQTKTLMLAEVSEEYVFKTISPAMKPEEEVRPKRAIIMIVGTLFGGFFSIIIVLIRNIRK